MTVNAICPGFAATDVVWSSARTIAAKTGTTYEEAVEALARMNAGGRLIQPDEVAGAVVKLLHDDRNGEAVILDGRVPG